MIKLLAQGKNGKPVVIFGFSELNVQKLKEGLPISFDGDELGIPAQFVIMYGDTEESMVKQLGLSPEVEEEVLDDGRGRPN